MTGTLLILALVTTNVISTEPPAPTVGDPISISAGPNAQVLIKESPAYEIITARGPKGVVRSFRPGTMKVEGDVIHREGAVPFAVEVAIVSVLAPDDSMEPAPLHPPVPLPPDRKAQIAIGSAIAAALLAWAALIWLAPKTPKSVTEVRLSAAQRFRRELAVAAGMSSLTAQVAEIGSATRRYLAEVDPHAEPALSSRELRRTLANAGVPQRTIDHIAHILDEADYAKFSPWGARPIEPAALVEEAAALAPRDEVSS